MPRKSISIKKGGLNKNKILMIVGVTVLVITGIVLGLFFGGVFDKKDPSDAELIISTATLVNESFRLNEHFVEEFSATPDIVTICGHKFKIEKGPLELFLNEVEDIVSASSSSTQAEMIVKITALLDRDIYRGVKEILNIRPTLPTYTSYDLDPLEDIIEMIQKDDSYPDGTKAINAHVFITTYIINKQNSSRLPDVNSLLQSSWHQLVRDGKETEEMMDKVIKASMTFMNVSPGDAAQGSRIFIVDKTKAGAAFDNLDMVESNDILVLYSTDSSNNICNTNQKIKILPSSKSFICTPDTDTKVIDLQKIREIIHPDFDGRCATAAGGGKR
jgi:hypothetical protein